MCVLGRETVGLSFCSGSLSPSLSFATTEGISLWSTREAECCIQGKCVQKDNAKTQLQTIILCQEKREVPECFKRAVRWDGGKECDSWCDTTPDHPLTTQL